MNSITVTEKDITVNGFIVPSIDIPEISYSYLYYEPDAENTFRVIPVEDVFQQVDLTEEEIAVCEAYCEAFDSTPYEVEVVDTSAEDPEESVLVVEADGRWKGWMLGSEMEEGDYIVDAMEDGSFSTKDSLTFSPRDFTWDGTAWVLDSVSDKRRFEQLTQNPVTDQLDFLIKAIDVLSNGDPLPADVQAFISQWKEIKANNVGG